MKQRYIGLLFVVLALLVGVLLYAATRTSSIYLNQWLSDIGDGKFFAFLQSLDSACPGWVVYSLPDGLWMSALIALILIIWDYTLSCRSILWLGLAFAFGILLEVLQGVGLVPGTFDVLDIIFMLLGAILPICVCDSSRSHLDQQPSHTLFLTTDRRII